MNAKNANRLTDERYEVCDYCGWCEESNVAHDCRKALMTQISELRKENENLRELLTEIACSGVEYEDKRIDYVVVQVDRTIWKEDLNEFRPGG